jgi:CheY-like chemotaxis protein
MNILIVEDELLLSLVIEQMIIRLGHNVLDKVSTGEEAVEKALMLKPDLILMDVRLAGKIDGIEAMEQISTLADIPVIYVSGNTDKANFERAKKTNCLEFLTKPININDLDRCFSLAC